MDEEVACPIFSMAAIGTMDSAVTICVFAKPPRPGRVKLRLAADIGAVAAAEIADALLTDVIVASRQLRNARVILSVTEPFVIDGFENIPQWVQPAGSLDVRIEEALRKALVDSSIAVALGADTPGLSAEMISDALQKLGNADSVLGPTEDGGFYLLALKQCPQGVLRNVRWSTAHALRDATAQIKQAGMTTVITNPWYDIDTMSDLLRTRQEIQSGTIFAPCLASALLRIDERVRTP